MLNGRIDTALSPTALSPSFSRPQFKPRLAPPVDLFSADPLTSRNSEGELPAIGEKLHLLRQALLLSQARVAIADRDLLEFVDCSPAAHQRLGYSRGEFLALGPLGLQIDPAHDTAWLKRQAALLHREGRHSFQALHRCRDGGCADLVVHLQLVTCGCEELVLLSHHGPGERRGRPKEAERLNQLLLDAEQLSQLGSWELDHHSGELLWSKGTFWIFETNELSFSPSYEGFLAMVHPQDRDLVDQVYRMSLKTREPYQMQHRICLPDGRQKVVQERGTTSYDDAGNPLRSIGTVQDISKLAEAERKLEQAAYEDPLTGLANRQAAQRQLADLLRDPDLWQEAGGLGVFNLDLDQFQAINDTFGFELGDQLLVAVSRTLAQNLQPQAQLARLESDEFLVVLPCRANQLEQHARALQQLLLRADHDHPHLPMTPRVSVGASHAPSHGDTPLSLMQAANTALMEAKKQGRASFCSYNSAISEEIKQRVALEAELQRALAGDAQGFELAFQPQVDQQGSIVGAEVLLRFYTSKGQAVPADVFIPLAETTGQIHAITLWVCEQTCQQLQRWRQSGVQGPRLAINLSAVEIGMANQPLMQALMTCLERHQLSSQDLELEITETALLRNPDGSQAETDALSQAGFKIAIDDFGTGFASLVCLHTLPLHKIKIDISFVQRMEQDPVALSIVRSTILLAHELNLQALAEGVETESQWQHLRELGCDLFQGYLFGQPMSADSFVDHLLRPRSTSEEA